jgi:hypothetical protein
MINWIIRMNVKYRLSKVGIETTFFRGMLEKQLKQRLREEIEADSTVKSFHVDELQTRWRKGEGKKIRIEGMVGYHERGDILFPGDRGISLDEYAHQLRAQRGLFADMSHQMQTYTMNHMPEPNDLIDALSWQLQLVQAGGRQESVDIPKNSPAWLEHKWIENHTRMQKHVPRNKQRKFQISLS